MGLDDEKQRKMIEYTIQEVVWYPIEDKDIIKEQATEEFFLSDVCEKLKEVEVDYF